MTTQPPIMLTMILPSDIVALLLVDSEIGHEVNRMRPAMYAFQSGGRRDKDVSGGLGDDELLLNTAANTGDGDPHSDSSDTPASNTAILDDGGVRPAAVEGKHRGKSVRRGGSSTERFEITRDRPIFTLSVAADLLGLHPRTLRIYEEKKLVIPSRTEGNRRRYSQRDIERFQFIRFLTGGGVNLEGVRIILDMAEELRKLGGDPSAIIERNLQSFGEGDQ